MGLCVLEWIEKFLKWKSSVVKKELKIVVKAESDTS